MHNVCVERIFASHISNLTYWLRTQHRVWMLESTEALPVLDERKRERKRVVQIQSMGVGLRRLNGSYTDRETMYVFLFRKFSRRYTTTVKFESQQLLAWLKLSEILERQNGRRKEDGRTKSNFGKRHDCAILYI